MLANTAPTHERLTHFEDNTKLLRHLKMAAEMKTAQQT